MSRHEPPDPNEPGGCQCRYCREGDPDGPNPPRIDEHEHPYDSDHDPDVDPTVQDEEDDR